MNDQNLVSEVKPNEVNAQDQNVLLSNEPVPSIKSEENQENWKKFREEREKDRKAKKEAESRAEAKEAEALALKTAMEAILNKSQPISNDQNYFNEENDDDRIKKLVAIELEKAERNRKIEAERVEQETFPQRLEKNYSDFNRICTTENFDYLEYHYPEVTKALKRLPEGYEKWETIYQNIRKFVPPVNTKKEESKIERNLQKPNSISNSSTTQSYYAAPPIRLDESRKSANWERMQKALKGIN